MNGWEEPLRTDHSMDIRTVYRQEVDALWGDGKGMSLAAVAIGWGLLVGTRMVYPVIIPYLQTTYGLSLTLAGVLVSVLWLFGSLGQLPGGILADRYNERTILVGSTVLVAVALGFIITSSSLVVLFLATALWGVGHSLYPIARITLLSKLYSERFGSVLGVVMAAGDIGQTILPPLAATLAAVFVWQAGLAILTPLLLLAGLFITITVPTSEASKASANIQSTRDISEIVMELRNPTMGTMTILLFLFGFAWQSFTAFYPTYLTTVKGVSPAVASILFGFFFATGIIIKPMAGAAYDRIGVRGSLIGSLLPAIAGLLLLPFVENIWFLVTLTALVSTVLGMGAITQAYLADTLPTEMQGTGLGVIRTASFTFAAGGPVIFGAVADYGYFDEGYVALAIINTAVLLLAFKLPKIGS